MDEATTVRSLSCWSGESQAAVSGCANGRPARSAMAAVSTPPAPSTASPSGPIRSQSPGSSAPMALSTASASSPTIHFSGLPPASGTGRALIHAAARRPASAAPASAPIAVQSRRPATVRPCRGRPGPGDELDCDEFPMASTFEGAARKHYEGSQYTDEFSVRYIDRVENQEAGRRLGAWYDNDRILNNDAFILVVGN